MSRAQQNSLTLNPLVVLAGVILILYFARAVLIPLAFALALTFLLSPLVEWLQKLRLHRLSAVALAILLALAVLLGLGSVVGRQLLQVANDLPKYRMNIHNKIEALHYRPDSALGRAAEGLNEIGAEFAEPEPSTAAPAAAPSPEKNVRAGSNNTTAPPAAPLPVQIVTLPTNGFESLREVLVPLVRPLGMTGMVLIFTVFILIKQEDLRNRLLRLAGVAQLHAMTLALNDAARRVSRYLGSQLLVNSCYGVCFGTGLFLIGIPSAPLWGILAGVLRMVPYAGALTAMAFPCVLALAVFDGWGPPVLVILLYVLLEFIAANVVEPWLYGARTGISALALLVTTVFWTILWGWAGLILAIPLTVCVIVVGRYFPRLSFLHILLGDETALSLEAQFYQRLLALDQDDARTIALNFLKDHSLAELYDQVLIPALMLSEQDRHKGALDERRESFLFLSFSEIVSESAVYRPAGMAPRARLFRSQRAFAARPEARTGPAAPEPAAVRIFCFAANDQADEITSSMLAQLLERSGFGVVSLPASTVVEQLLTHVPPEPNDVICISALPPFAFAQACALCQRIRIQLPDIRILAGIWGFPGEMEKALERFGSVLPNRVVVSLTQAVEQIGAWNKASGRESADYSPLDATP